eukprot:jgi/Psemu1/109/gm1.109_g
MNTNREGNQSLRNLPLDPDSSIQTEASTVTSATRDRDNDNDNDNYYNNEETMNEEDFGHRSSSALIDDEFMEELRELGMSPTITIHNKNSDSDSDSEDDGDSYVSHGDAYSAWGNESYLGDLMNQRECRDHLQREEVMEEALERFNLIPNIINKKTGERKSNLLFLKLVDQVEVEMAEEFRKRNELQDQRIANELLSKAERLHQKKSRSSNRVKAEESEAEEEAEAGRNKESESEIIESNDEMYSEEERSLEDVEEEEEGDEEESDDECSLDVNEAVPYQHSHKRSHEYSPRRRRSVHDSSSSLRDSSRMTVSLAPSPLTSKSLVSVGSAGDDRGLIFDDAATSSSHEDSSHDDDDDDDDGIEDAESSSGSSSSDSSSDSDSGSDSSSSNSSQSEIEIEIEIENGNEIEIENESENENESYLEPKPEPEAEPEPLRRPKLVPKEEQTKSGSQWTLIRPATFDDDDETSASEGGDVEKPLKFAKRGNYSGAFDDGDGDGDGDDAEPKVDVHVDVEPDVDVNVDVDPCGELQFWGRKEELDSLQRRFLATVGPEGNRDDDDDDDDTEEIMGSTTRVQVPPKHAWVTGIPGIGKSALVETFLQQVQNDAVRAQQPFVCRGSFEQNRMDTSNPFPGILSCFADLFEIFLNRDDTEKWGEMIQNSFDNANDVAILILLIPSLGVLLDVHIEDAEYVFDKRDKFAFERLTGGLRSILTAICQQSSVIFALDNVHLATDDSLRLLKALLSTENLGNFFFLGSHRSGIKHSHPLPKLKTEISSLFGADIKLGGIDERTTKSMVQHQLLRQLNNESSISEKTLKSFVDKWHSHALCTNPLFLQQFVHLLHDQNNLQFRKRWTVDLDADVPSSLLNVVEQRLEVLPKKHNVILQGAALLDVNTFRTETLVVAVETLPESQKLEIDIVDVESILDSLAKKRLIKKLAADRYAFEHDVFRTASASRIPPSKKKRSRLHWRLATNLKALLTNSNHDDDDDDELAAESSSGGNGNDTSSLVAYHLKKGMPSVEQTNKTEMAVTFFLRLGKAAMKRSAFATATEMFEICMSALYKKTKWEDSYTLTLRTHLALAQSLYCAGDLDRAKSLLNTVVANAHPPRDAIDAFDLLISICRSKRQYEHAKQCALKALSDIWQDDVSDMNVEEKFLKVRKLVQNKSDADLLVLFDMEHKKISKKMPFLLQLAEVSGLCRDFKLQDLASLRMLELTLRYGSYEINFTGLVFALCGLCVSRRRLYGEAYRYGRLAEMMSETGNPLGRQAIAHHSFAMRHWRHTLKSSPKSLGDLCRASIESNEEEHLSFQIGAYISSMLYTGASFAREDELLKKYHEERIRLDLPESWMATLPYNCMMKLKGQSKKIVKKKQFDTKAVQYEIFFEMVTAVFMHDMEKAGVLNAKIFVKPGGCWAPYRVFMQGLLATHFAQVSEGTNKMMHQKEATKFVNILTTWTKKGMSNSAHMANILKVELTLASDRAIASKRIAILVDTSIACAYQDGFPHHAALASERAGLFFLKQDDEQLARKYLSRAVSLYKGWGAFAKVRQLETGYRKYLGATPLPIACMQRSSGSLMFTEQRNSLASNRSPISPRGSMMSSGRNFMSSSTSLMSSRRDLSSGSSPGARRRSRERVMSMSNGTLGSLNSAKSERRSSLFSLPRNLSPKRSPATNSKGRLSLDQGGSKSKKRPSFLKSLSFRPSLSSKSKAAAEENESGSGRGGGKRDRFNSRNNNSINNNNSNNNNNNNSNTPTGVGRSPGGTRTRRAVRGTKHKYLPTAAPLVEATEPKRFSISKRKNLKKEAVDPDYDNWLTSSYMMKYSAKDLDSNSNSSEEDDDEKPGVSKAKATTKKKKHVPKTLVKKKKGGKAKATTKAAISKSDDSSLEDDTPKPRYPKKHAPGGGKPKRPTDLMAKMDRNSFIGRPKGKQKYEVEQ